MQSTLLDLARGFTTVITVEDGCRLGGVGAAIAQACADAGVAGPVRKLGLPERFVGHGNAPRSSPSWAWMPRGSPAPSSNAPPVEEVKVGNQILAALGLRPRGLEIVSCPSCGRAIVRA